VRNVLGGDRACSLLLSVVESDADDVARDAGLLGRGAGGYSPSICYAVFLSE
jgi:hypothetical protein